MIANGEIIAWKSSFFSDIGDNIGIFPISYLSRIEYYMTNNITNINTARDWTVINTTATYYIPEYPKRISDNTKINQQKKKTDTATKFTAHERSLRSCMTNRATIIT